MSTDVTQRLEPIAPPDRPHLNYAELKEVLDLSLRAGQLMIENGANTARVEQTIERLGHALGAERMDVYVTPTGIIASDHSGREHRTKLVRIYHSSIDLSRIASVMDVARGVVEGRLGRAGVRTELERIAARARLYRLPLTSFMVAVACAGFALNIGGGPLEAAATAIAAGFAHLMRFQLGKLNLGRFTATLFVAVVASWIGLMLARWMGAPNPEIALLSPVLLLVPGVLMVSSVADLFRGDTVSGVARGVQAFLFTSVLGAGLWITTLLSGTRMTNATTMSLPLYVAIPVAFFATLGFAILFNVPRRALMIASFVGMCAFGARAVALRLDAPPEIAMLMGGMMSALLAEPASRWLKMPTSIFIMPGFIPLVPGVAAFRTLLELANENYTTGTAGLVRTGIQVLALAAGVGVMNALRPTPREA